MIAEIIPGIFDPIGNKVFRPDMKRRGIRPTFPMGRNFSQPLTIKCKDIDEIRDFLLKCKGVSDKKQFEREDYWQPPDSFELTRKGDCEDFSLWTWRQLVDLGFDARFAIGTHGRYRGGHAFVLLYSDNRIFLIEPQAALLRRLPRLSTLSYHLKYSVGWDGSSPQFYSHGDDTRNIRLTDVIANLPEWVATWGWFWITHIHRVPINLAGMLLRRLKSNSGSRS